jgi:hypothetical protein
MFILNKILFIFFDEMSVNLVGQYYGDSYGGNGTHTIAIGWSDLYIGEFIPGRFAGFRIDRYGEPIGWAPMSSIRKR